jgi:WD40 repeat protein
MQKILSDVLLVCRSESGHVTCWDARRTSEEMATLRCAEEPVLCTSTQPHCAAQARTADASENAGDSPTQACLNGEGSRRQMGNIDVENHSSQTISFPAGPQGATHSTRLAIVAGTAGSQLQWLTLSENSQMTLRRKENLSEEGVGDVCVRQDGRLVAVGGWDARIRLFHMRTGKRLAVLKQHRASITAVKFDEGGLIACASRDKTISLWDVYREG